MDRKLYRVLRKKELPPYVGLQGTQLNLLIKTPDFPKPFRITDHGRAVVFLESEVIEWQMRRLAKREAA